MHAEKRCMRSVFLHGQGKECEKRSFSGIEKQIRKNFASEQKI
jgi:hypothetical protein